MKELLALLLLVAIARAATENAPQSDKILFQKFVVDYGRRYATEEEKLFRFGVFQENLRKAEVLTAESANQTTYGVTQFSDWTATEWRRLTPFFNVSSGPAAPKGLRTTTGAKRVKEYPVSYDWRSSANVVTPIRDQRVPCGSGWAFAAAAEAEGQLRWGVWLSVQELMDCVTSCAGCGGGSFVTAWQTVGDTIGGWNKEIDYQYEAKVSVCRYKPWKNVYRPDSDEIHHVDYDGEGYPEVLDNIYSHGPLAAGLNADTMQSYTGGIMVHSSACGGAPNHAVAIVGYAFSQTTQRPYYIVKNSVGTGWGLSGYALIDYGACSISRNVWRENRH